MKNRRRVGTYIVVCLLVFFEVLVLSGCVKRAESQKGLDTFVSEFAEESETEAVAGVEAEVTTDTGVKTAVDAAPDMETVARVEEPRQCYVHICGAVAVPGVYAMLQGDRIFHVIEAAGGFLEDACVDYVNQAQVLSDGCRIWIPTEEQAKDAGWQHPDTQIEMMVTADAKTVAADDGAGRININTATITQLCGLSGIGQTKAEAIVAYREAHGDFIKREDIMKVAGIKQSGYDKIKDQITVGRE